MAKKKKAGCTRKRVAQPKKKPKEPRIYIGPTILGVAVQNRIYDVVPEPLEEMIREVPETGNLLIAIRDYPDAERMLRTGRGYAASAFRKAVQYNSKKGGSD